MSAHRKAFPALLATLTLAAPLADQARAQSIWLPSDTDRASVSLEVFKPIPTPENDYWTPITSAFVLSGRVPVRGNLMIAAELPFAHAEMELQRFGGEGTVANSVVGNPYLGIQYASASSPVFADAGVRIPLRKEQVREFGDLAADVGLVSDFDRMEAYLADYLAVGGRIGIQQRTETGLVLRARGGPILWAYTGSSDYRENEVWLDYSAQAGYETGRFSVLGGLTGRAILSEEGTFAERSFHQLGTSGSVTVGGVKPGISLRVPIDEDLGEALRYVIGVQLTVPIR